MTSSVVFRVKHEFAVVPMARCSAFAEAVAELERARLRAQEIAFEALPAFFRELPAWRSLAAHRLAGARRAWSDGGAAASGLAAALAARAPTVEWAWLEATAAALDVAHAAQIAAALAGLVAEPEGPRQLVDSALVRSREFDAGDHPAADDVARWLAWPDGLDHGPAGALCELLRNLCAAAHDAAKSGDGLLYLSYSPELTPA